MGNARQISEFNAMIAQPGIIDSHLHLGINPYGFKMEALAGVTTCLDMAGETDFILENSRKDGSGINFAILQALLPGKISPPTIPVPMKSIPLSIKYSQAAPMA